MKSAQSAIYRIERKVVRPQLKHLTSNHFVERTEKIE